MAGAEVKEAVLFLPQEIVQKSVGFSLDVGSSLIKVIYRSNRDFTRGEPINVEAVRDGLARVYLFHIPRHSGCKPVRDIINKKCDVKRPFNKGKVKVAVTGIGANLFKDELEKQLNVELSILIEDGCGVTAFKFLAEITPVEDFLYPIPDDYKKGAEEIKGMMAGLFAAHNTTSYENYSKMPYGERYIPEGDKPFLPCLLVIHGAGTLIIKLDTKGESSFCDFNLMAGAVFERFASHNHGPISFEDLNSKLENADFSTVDDTAAEHLAGDSDSDYALIKSNARILPFGKLIGNPAPDKMKKEDVTLSFLRSLAEVQGHLAHVHALAHQVRKIYFIGGFIHMELMRRYLYEEITSRNLMRPESQQIEIHFVRQGGHMNAIGAFVEGVKQNDSNKSKIKLGTNCFSH